MNENTVTITQGEYKNLVSAKIIADQLVNYISRKSASNESIYSSELQTICCVLGISTNVEGETC